MMMTRRKIRHTRMALMWLQGCVCATCPRVLDIDGDTRNKRPTFDHITPRSQGSRINIANGLAKCNSCNHKRGAKPPSERDLAQRDLNLSRVNLLPYDLTERVAQVRERTAELLELATPDGTLAAYDYVTGVATPHRLSRAAGPYAHRDRERAA